MIGLDAAGGAGAFEHTALFVESSRDAARQLAPMITDAVRRDEAVYAFVDAARWRAISAAVAPDVLAQTRFVPAQERYGSPGRALKVLLDTFRAEHEAGTTRLLSIGELAFTGGAMDAEWLRYEAAVNDVLGDVPIHGVCLYDHERIPDTIVDAVCQTHTAVQGSMQSPCGRDFDPIGMLAELPQHDLAPERPPDEQLVGNAPTRMRRAIQAVGHRWVDDVETAGDLALIAGELLANTAVHAGGDARVSLWNEPDRIVLVVADDGPGISDPYAGLRPPPVSEHGAGLWIVAQLADALQVDRRARRGSQVTAVLDKP